MSTTARIRLTGLIALAVAGAASARAVGPPPGQGQATLCVSTSSRPANCGPAQSDVAADGSIRLRIDDIVYQMRLRSTQVDIVLMHGSVQIDEFTAPFVWSGTTLRFSDDERESRYEVRFARRAQAAR